MNEKIFTKTFWMVFGALFCSAMVMYTLISTITEYATSMGSSATLAGMVSGIYVFGGLCSRVYSGRALEKVGWKKLALIFAGIHMIACCFYFFVTNITLLILVRFIHGIGFGASANAIVTIGMSILPKKRFSEACGYFMLATTLAVGFGPYFGGMVYDFYGSVGCFIMAMALCILTFVFLLVIDIRDIDPGIRKASEKRTSDDASIENAEAVNRKKTVHGIEQIIEIKALPISIVTGLICLGYVSIMSFYRLYADETNLVKEFSGFFLLYSLILIFTRPIAGRIQDKYGDRTICIPGIIAQCIGIFLIAWHPSAFTVVLCAIGCAFGYGTLSSACNAIACRNATVERRSYAVSTFYICCDVGMGIGPAILGAFVTIFGSYAKMYYAAAFITLIGLFLCLYVLRKDRKVAENSQR